MRQKTPLFRQRYCLVFPLSFTRHRLCLAFPLPFFSKTALLPSLCRSDCERPRWRGPGSEDLRPTPSTPALTRRWCCRRARLVLVRHEERQAFLFLKQCLSSLKRCLSSLSGASHAELPRPGLAALQLRGSPEHGGGERKTYTCKHCLCVASAFLFFFKTRKGRVICCV